MALNPSLHEAFHYYGRHCYALGDFAKAATLLEQAFNLRPDQYTVLGLALSALEATGDTARSRAMSLRVRDGLRPNEFATLYNVACNYARAGECDLALELLERAVQLGSGYLEWFEHDPDLANLRENPRFQHLLEQLRAAREQVVAADQPAAQPASAGSCRSKSAAGCAADGVSAAVKLRLPVRSRRSATAAKDHPCGRS